MAKFLPQFLVVLAVTLAFALFRRFAPRNPAEEHVADNGRRLPYGVAGACMWLLGIAIAVGGFFALRTANHLWSHPYQDALFVAYPPQVIWMFLPGFAAVAIPWVFTLWLLRRFGYAGQAAEIVENANQKGGFNCERVMKWLIWIIVVPIGLFTLPAIPMHLAVKSDQALLTHYGHIFPNRFYFSDARRAYWVEGHYVRVGSIAATRQPLARPNRPGCNPHQSRKRYSHKQLNLPALTSSRARSAHLSYTSLSEDFPHERWPRRTRRTRKAPPAGATARSRRPPAPRSHRPLATRAPRLVATLPALHKSAPTRSPLQFAHRRK